MNAADAEVAKIISKMDSSHAQELMKLLRQVHGNVNWKRFIARRQEELGMTDSDYKFISRSYVVNMKRPLMQIPQTLYRLFAIYIDLKLYKLFPFRDFYLFSCLDIPPQGFEHHMLSENAMQMALLYEKSTPAQQHAVDSILTAEDALPVTPNPGHQHSTLLQRLFQTLDPNTAAEWKARQKLSHPSPEYAKKIPFVS